MYYFTRADVGASAFLCAKHQTTGFLCAMMIDHPGYSCQEDFLIYCGRDSRMGQIRRWLTSRTRPLLMLLRFQTKPFEWITSFAPWAVRNVDFGPAYLLILPGSSIFGLTHRRSIISMRTFPEWKPTVSSVATPDGLIFTGTIKEKMWELTGNEYLAAVVCHQGQPVERIAHDSPPRPP